MIHCFPEGLRSCARWLFIGLCSLVMTACASPAVPRTAENPPVELAVKNTEQILLGRIANLRTLESIEFNSSSLGSGRFRLVDVYTSASGKNCRRIERETDGLRRVVCQQSGGTWSATRRLSRAVEPSDRSITSTYQGAVDASADSTPILTGG